MPHSTWIVQTVRHRVTTSALHQQGSASMSPRSWSSHKVKRSVSASLAGEVFMVSEGLAECDWISGVLEPAAYQDYEPSLHRRKSISLPAEPTVTVMKAGSHLQIDPSTASSMLKVFLIICCENRREVIADGQHKNYA